MGGCRCTYKNCTLRTDGVTHMFHYPVFDKVRCHKWLTNAEKLEFLNLKVSQLKNRVVCQHHFKDDNFMNFLKDKLTFDAVPTEDGPYCDTTQLSVKKNDQDDSKLYSISLDDIENEYLTLNDKKANFSVKYGDFLTNCDLMDLDSLNLTSDNTQIVSKSKSYEENCDTLLNDNIDCRKPVNTNSILNRTLDVFEPNIESVYTIHMTEVPIEIDKSQASGTLPKTTPDYKIQETAQKRNTKVFAHKQREPSKRKTGKSLLKDKKITILEEKKISQALLPLPVKLQPVSPSIVLPLPKRKRNLNQGDTENNSMHNISTKSVAPDVVEESNVELAKPVKPSTGKVFNHKVVNSDERLENVKTLEQLNSDNNNIVKETKQCASPPKTRSSVLNTTLNVKKANNLSLKNRIPPERIAAIEEKRKFNMKLRDIIASCLDKLDDEEDKDYNKGKLKTNIEKNITQKVSSYLSKEPELPSAHDYTVAYLEARMKKMEDILLHKIDQNSQRIIELKQTFAPLSSNKSVYTQTARSEELTKKHLYQEISKYLSPETNSLIYEELFINKFVPKVPQTTPSKKRKYR